MPRIYTDFEIINSTGIENKKNEKYYLLSKYLYLDTDYNHIYTMKYLEGIDGIYPNGYEFLDSNIDKNMITYNELVDIIKVEFSTKNMLKYFGSNSDLMPGDLRNTYNNMNKYFLFMFYNKISDIIGIQIKDISEDNGLLCVISECMSIIRASVKKYVRLRISPDTPTKYKKQSLNRRNSHKYGCSNIIEEYEYCPSFSQLLNGYTDGNGIKHKPKSCRNIMISALTTNDNYTALSKIPIPIIFPKKSYSTTFNLRHKNVRKRRLTRKISRKIPNQIYNKNNSINNMI
jgi:hypothetical protein